MAREENVTVIATLPGVEHHLDPEGTVELVWPEPGDSSLTLRVSSHQGAVKVHLDHQRVTALVMALAAAGHHL